jgi:hypothetical protein
VYLFDVYSIDTKVVPITGDWTRVNSYMGLIKRTEKPVSLSEADRMLSELQSKGHIVELRRLVSEEFREWTKGYV